MKAILLSVCLALASAFTGLAQYTNLNLEVISGNRLVFNQPGVIEKEFNEEWKLKKRELTDRSWEGIRNHMKIRTVQGLRDETIVFGYQRFFSVNMHDTSCYLKIVIPDIFFSFFITTPDVLGIGKDRSEDPFISFKFTIEGIFWLTQKGDAKSIEFQKPVWTYTLQEKKSSRLENLSVAKYIEDDVKGLAFGIKEQFYLLNDFTFKINNFINDKIIQDPRVQKEFSIDENNQLQVYAENMNKLVFKHNYSQRGFVKRNSTTDASIVTEEVKSIPPPAGTTTSPADIDKKPYSPSPGPIINKPVGPGTKPTGFDKKPNSTTPGSKINKPPVRNN